jgi:hypothetical protein
MIKIDTNDNTVAGFWVTGKDYFVRVEGTTIDGATINSVVGHFSIENRFMRGTDSAALAATALTNVTWTDAKAGHLDAPISTVDTVVDGIQTDLSNAADGLGALKALIDTVDGVVDTILVDSNDLQTNQGAWATAVGFSTHSAADVKTAIEAAGSSIALMLADTNELQTDWVNAGRLDTLLDACNTVTPDAAGVAPTVGEIRTEMEGAGTKLTLALGDTDELQTNQGNWATAAGFSTHSAADVKTAMEAAGSKLTLVLADTADMQPNQGNWATAVGFSTHSAADVKTAIEAGGSSIALILADTGELQTDWANGGRLDLLIDAILLDTGTTLDALVKRILGLEQENIFIDNTTYAGVHMTGCRIRIYSVAGSVGGAGDVIATYTMTATYTGDEMDDYKVVKA